ncbi:V-type ATPase subunit [Patescibacteria group bacterium]|nr:V-type ATPase subunit [Patescibacteria group bacterium]
MNHIQDKYDFTYSVALVRTLENFLLNENEVERMVLAKSANESFKILNELDYSDNKVGINDVADFQEVINEGLIDIKTTLEKVTPNKRILQIIWLQYDFHNIKTLIKAFLSGKTFEDVKHLMNDLGTIPIESLKKFIFDNEIVAPFYLEEITETYLKKKIKKVQELFEKEHKNPQVIDLYLDQKLMKIIFNIATDSKNNFLIRYVQKLIDLSNIRLFFRMKAQDKELETYEIAFLWNGNISFQKFQEAYKHKLSEFPETMKTSDYYKIISEGYKHYEAEKTFIFLEKEIENHLISYIKESKLIAFGPEPLIAYFLAKANNALSIRMILLNKLSNIEPEHIHEKLRDLYS